MQFQKAERKKSKIRLALAGVSGSGKTYSALLVASGLGQRIAVIDTEKGSASLYSHLVDFDVLELEPPYTPERYRQAISLAEKSGYDVIIIDSITHEWSGTGGILELNDQIAKAKYKGNTWSAWSELTPRHRALIDDILNSTSHVIVTMRSKTETAQVEVNGRKQVKKLGVKAEQRDGIEYEFTTVLEIDHETHNAIASKDRTGLFLQDPVLLNQEVGERLIEWMNSGKEIRQSDTNSLETILQHFLQNAEKAQTLEQLKQDFGKVWTLLKTAPALQQQATDFYNIRKSEFEQGDI